MVTKKNDPRKILKYVFFGGVTAGVEFVSFLLLEKVAHVYIASSISFALGLMSSFVCNKFIVFKNSKAVTKGEIISFIILGVINSQLSSLMTYGLSFILSKPAAKIITMAVIACWNYGVMNFVIFKNGEKTHE